MVCADPKGVESWLVLIACRPCPRDDEDPCVLIVPEEVPRARMVLGKCSDILHDVVDELGVFVGRSVVLADVLPLLRGKQLE